jgi:hypothetical protein
VVPSKYSASWQKESSNLFKTMIEICLSPMMPSGYMLFEILGHNRLELRELNMLSNIGAQPPRIVVDGAASARQVAAPVQPGSSRRNAKQSMRPAPEHELSHRAECCCEVVSSSRYNHRVNDSVACSRSSDSLVVARLAS